LLTTSGGVAFFALLAIFPALATIVSLYSLFADPHAIPERVALLAGVVPTSIIDLIKGEIQSLAEKNISTLSTAFLIGLVVSMWSANSGVSALFDALNVVHGKTEERSLLQFYATTFAVTLGAVVYGLIATIDVLPMAFRFLGLGEHVQNFEPIFRWAATLLIVMIWLSIVYRVGPSRSNAKWRWVTWGSGLAAILLVVASIAFSRYLAEFNSYDRLYGSLGAVVGLMTWLWISIVVMLLGAEVDAAIERSALGPDLAGLQRDGSDERDFELERRTANAFLEHRLDGEAHAAIEKRRRKTTMHRTPWIEVSACWIERDGDPTAFGLHHVIAQGLRDRVQGQRAAGKAPDELQPVHLLLSLGTDRPVSPVGHAYHRFSQQ